MLSSINAIAHGLHASREGATTELVRTMLRDNVGLFLAPPGLRCPPPALGRLDRLAAYTRPRSRAGK